MYIVARVMIKIIGTCFSLVRPTLRYWTNMNYVPPVYYHFYRFYAYFSKECFEFLTMEKITEIIFIQFNFIHSLFCNPSIYTQALSIDFTNQACFIFTSTLFQKHFRRSFIPNLFQVKHASWWSSFWNGYKKKYGYVDIGSTIQFL